LLRDRTAADQGAADQAERDARPPRTATR